MNLFSIFDPTTNMLSLNWISLFLVFFMIFYKFWMGYSKYLLLNMKYEMFFLKEMQPITKKSSYSYVMLLFSFFIMIVMLNLLGLIPYIFTPTSHIVVTLSFAVPIWMSLMMFGWKNNYNSMFSHLVPLSTPVVLMPFMVLIETISNMIRPITLSVRLAANLTAGHLLITLLTNQNIYTFNLSVYFSQILLLFLEFGVALIQAYVFTVLMSLYMSEIK